MYKSVLVFILLLVCSASKGQSGDSAASSSKAHLFPGMESLLERHHDFMKEREIEGFKVQVYSGTTKDAAFRIRNELQSLVDGQEIKIGFERPYYRVRVGNFRDRFEAYKLAQELAEYFTRSAVYPDVIEPEKISVAAVIREQEKASAQKKYIAPE